MNNLKKYTVEIEIAAPITADVEEVVEYIRSIMSDSDVAAENNVFAVGEVEVIDENVITIDEWNGDIEKIELDKI